MKIRPSDERSPDIAPPRSDSYQKERLFRLKTRPIQTRYGTLNPDDPKPALFILADEKPENHYDQSPTRAWNFWIAGTSATPRTGSATTSRSSYKQPRMMDYPPPEEWVSRLAYATLWAA